MTDPSKAVFLSYASQDAAAARRICEALRAAGIEVWFDQSELRGGDLWDQKIRLQIRDCALFIPIISVNTASRLEGYFRLEWKLAVDRSHLMAAEKPFLLPVVVDGTQDANAHVPDKFREVQWVRLSAGDTPPAFAERVSRLLSLEQTAPADVSSRATAAPLIAAAPSRAPTARSRAQRLPLLIAAVAVIGVGYLALDKFVLSKRPTAGVQTAAPTAASVGARSTIPEKSIAVLPFVDMSEKKDQEYFSDGLSEELIEHLARSPELRVIARTSSFSFKGKADDVPTIAHKLNVAIILEGSVRKSGNELRITTQLIRASDGSHIWSQTYERTLDDIFRVQDEIAATVAHALQVALNEPAARSRAVNMDAYNLVLKGNYNARLHTKAGRNSAIAFYQDAIKLDPEYALAWASLGSETIACGCNPNDPSSTKGLEYLKQALQVDPNLAIAHSSLGWYYFQTAPGYAANWRQARNEFRRAVELDPNDFRSKAQIAFMEQGIHGDYDAKISNLRKVILNDPLDTSALWHLAFSLYLANHLEASLTAYKELSQLQPAFPNLNHDIAWLYLFLGRPSEALAAAEKEPDEDERLIVLAATYWALGRRTDSDTSVQILEKKFSAEDADEIAGVHAFRGERDLAFHWLDRMYSEQQGAAWEICCSPTYANLRRDPRYDALLVKFGFDQWKRDRDTD